MGITDLLDEHGIEYRQAGEDHHVSKGWIGLVCPEHGGPSYHLGYNITGRFLSCWKCGLLPLFSTLGDLGIPWQRLKEALGWEVWETARKAAKRKGKLKYPKGWHPHLLPPHEHYLKSRGFCPDELQKVWKLSGIGLAARLAWRLLIPVHFRGVVVSWTTRKCGNGPGLRYVNAKPDEEAVPAKSLLFGGDHVRHACVVTEGPFDAMRIGPGAVALLGTGWSKAQVNRLAKIPVRTIIFDNELEVQRRARRLADALSVFPGRTRVVEIDAADPGSAGKREVELVRRSFL